MFRHLREAQADVSFHITVMIMDQDDEIDPMEYDFFIKDNISLEAANMHKPWGWFPESGWKDLELLITLNQKFNNLRTDILSNESSWKAWYDFETPELAPIPEAYTLVEQLYKVFRTDRIYNGIKKFIVTQE